MAGWQQLFLPWVGRAIIANVYLSATSSVGTPSHPLTVGLFSKWPYIIASQTPTKELGVLSMCSGERLGQQHYPQDCAAAGCMCVVSIYLRECQPPGCVNSPTDTSAGLPGPPKH